MAHSYPSKSKIRSYFIKPFMMNKTTFHTGAEGQQSLQWGQGENHVLAFDVSEVFDTARMGPWLSSCAT